MRSRSSRSSRSRRSLAAMSPASRLTKKPFQPSRMSYGMLPTGVVTTGTPQAAASRQGLGVPSLRLAQT